MIRIDEIYNNTFWPWLKQNRPGTRMFYCDPPGRTDTDALFNFCDTTTTENNYVFFHDQEPIHLDLFKDLFNEVVIRNLDFAVTGRRLKLSKWQTPEYQTLFNQHVDNYPTQIGDFFKLHKDAWLEFKNENPSYYENPGHVIVSELGEYASQLSEVYRWKVHYYFYHGWACQDWFRGYDKTFLIPRAQYRTPTKTFMSPNRIVAGKRDHRVLFLYNVFKNHLDHNWISAPRTCSYENVDISVIANKYCNIYPDIEQVFTQAPLPKLFPGEDTQHMTSCWLTNFDQAADSLVYVPTETVYFGKRLHITEKTFKAIALEMPFVLVAPAGSLEYMRRYGFKTFSSVFDESYDLETDDTLRIEQVVQLLKDLDDLSVKERQDIHRACLPIVEHNYNHFYSGSFADNYLWPELVSMLKDIR